MPYESSSAASDVSLAAFGLRIIPAMQPSAARGKAAECVARRSLGLGVLGRVLCEQCGRHVHHPRAMNAVVAGFP
jgi:hypothetical protein